MMKIWLKSESNIAKYAMMPFTRNFFFGAQNLKIQEDVYTFINLPSQSYHFKSHSKRNNLATQN
jgi:hypothetical protein